MTATAPGRTALAEQLTGRNLLLLSLLATAVLALLWWFFVFSATREVMAQRGAELAEVRAQREGAQAARTQIPELQAQVAALRAEQGELLSALPEQAQLGRLFGALRQEVRLAGARLNRFTVSDTAPGAPTGELAAGVQAIGVQMEVGGSFEQVYGVMQAVETMRRFANLGNVGLRSEGDVQNPDVQSTLNFTVYTFDAERAAAETPETETETNWNEGIIQ